MNTLEAIRLKRAVREFTELPIEQPDIITILNAGRHAQSSKNSQPWNFIAISDKSILKGLAECGVYASHLAGAAIGVAIVHSEPGEKFQLLFDIGQCASYMQLAAWEIGIGSCLASIYDPDKAREVLGFPTELTIRFAISFGYPQDKDILGRLPRSGGRRPLEQIVHWNKW